MITIRNEDAHNLVIHSASRDVSDGWECTAHPSVVLVPPTMAKWILAGAARLCTEDFSIPIASGELVVAKGGEEAIASYDIRKADGTSVMSLLSYRTLSASKASLKWNLARGGARFDAVGFNPLYQVYRRRGGMTVLGITGYEYDVVASTDGVHHVAVLTSHLRDDALLERLQTLTLGSAKTLGCTLNR